MLHSRSRARLHPPERLDERVVECVLTIRDQPPEGLRRTPGPKALLYYLPRDEELAASRLRLPTSTRTIWRLLRQHGRILPRCPRQREPLERPAPLVAWQLDFKDASSVPAEPQGKRQHVVEVLDVVDTGTSLLLEALPRADFTAETALASLAAAFRRLGLPHSLTLDRDTRLVGAPQGSDFPSALLRFCRCLDVQVDVCPPHRPDRNAFVYMELQMCTLRSLLETRKCLLASSYQCISLIPLELPESVDPFSKSHIMEYVWIEN